MMMSWYTVEMDGVSTQLADSMPTLTASCPMARWQKPRIIFCL
jgi:hypothetical protein